MTATITRATVVGGHDGRAEIEVELTYDNGGISVISLDEEACTASLDSAGVSSLDDLVGQPWSTLLPAFEQPEFTSPNPPARISSNPNLKQPESQATGRCTCSISSSVTD